MAASPGAAPDSPLERATLGTFCALYTPVPSEVTDPATMQNETLYCALCDTENCPSSVVIAVEQRLEARFGVR